MDNYQSIIRSMLASSLKKNYRMSDRQKIAKKIPKMPKIHVQSNARVEKT